ncbi:MAG: DUF4105 domain-containing protein [Gammaproteobacteria bacterium]
MRRSGPCPRPRAATGARSRARPAPAVLVLVLWLWPLLALAQAAPRIGVMTMQPGEIFWERFGHNAIVVDDPAAPGPVSYNFGYFDLEEPGFVGRFVRGRMQYMLVALPLEQDLAYYRQTGRGVAIQWLDLDPAQARALAADLAANARPENARYGYDYFLDNCSTRVRDALDRALGGALRPQLAHDAGGLTFRGEAVRLARPARWMALGFDLGLGPRADAPLDRWQAGFVPMRLADGLRAVRHADGRPLVVAEQALLPHRIAPEPAPLPRRWWPQLLAGLALAGGALLLGRARPRALAALALPFWAACATAGLLLAFLWCCTAHWAAWSNHNLLLLSPLCLLALPGGWRVARGQAPGRWFTRARWLVAASALATLPLQLLPAAQDNLPWIALLLPPHLALAIAWRWRLPAAATGQRPSH